MIGLKRLLVAIRFPEWWYSKVALAVTVALSLALATDIGLGATLRKIALGTIAVAAGAAFGYGVNDVGDAETDRAAGKPRLALLAALRPSQALLWLSLLVPIGLGAALALHLVAMLIAACGFILAIVYSLEPFRLKEHGSAGAATVACAQGAVSTALFLSVFPRDEPRSGFLAAGLLVWSVMVGARAIALHQILDIHEDRRAGIRTWAVSRGETDLRRFIDRVILPSEVAAFLVVASVLVVASPWILVGLPLALLASIVRRSEASSDDQRVFLLADAYTTWWPFGVGVGLAIEDARYVGVAAGYFFAFKTTRWLWHRLPTRQRDSQIRFRSSRSF